MADNIHIDPTAADPSLIPPFPQSNPSAATPQRQVDLSRLFSDVSRTVSGIKTILGGGGSGSSIGSASSPHQSPLTGAQDSPLSGMPSPSSAPPPAETESSMPFAGLFGGSNVCFKTCGMEDIQFAARRAGEMFSTMRTCMLVLTGVIVLAVVIISSTLLFYIYRNRRNLFTSRHNNGGSSSGSSCGGSISASHCTTPGGTAHHLSISAPLMHHPNKFGASGISTNANTAPSKALEFAQPGDEIPSAEQCKQRSPTSLQNTGYRGLVARKFHTEASQH